MTCGSKERSRFHTNRSFDQGNQLRILWRVERCFYLQNTGYHSTASIKTNSFIISFTKLCYIKILIGEHNTGKWEHPYTAIFQCKLSNLFFLLLFIFAKAILQQKEKSVKMLIFFGLLTLPLGNLSKEIIWFSRIKIFSSEELNWGVNRCMHKGKIKEKQIHLELPKWWRRFLKIGWFTWWNSIQPLSTVTKII